MQSGYDIAGLKVAEASPPGMLDEVATEDSPIRLVHGPAPCREGWGVHLAGYTKYEGEWLDDKRHGLGCDSVRVGDRFMGQFADGHRAGTGVCLSQRGVLRTETWKDGRLLGRRPVFRKRSGAKSANMNSEEAACTCFGAIFEISASALCSYFICR